MISMYRTTQNRLYYAEVMFGFCLPGGGGIPIISDFKNNFSREEYSKYINEKYVRINKVFYNCFNILLLPINLEISKSISKPNISIFMRNTCINQYQSPISTANIKNN